MVIDDIATAADLAQAIGAAKSHAYVGWRRRSGRRQRWAPVVGADSYDDAWKKLHAKPSPWQHTDSVVLPAGEDPNEPTTR